MPVEERTGGRPEDVSSLAYRWSPRSGGGAVLEERQGGADFFAPPIRLEQCHQARQPPFTRLTCPAASLLYVNQRLLFASFDDYGVAATEWLTTLQAGEQEVHLVRVGLKSQVVPGLLFQDGGRWRLLIRPADYALLC